MIGHFDAGYIISIYKANKDTTMDKNRQSSLKVGVEP